MKLFIQMVLGWVACCLLASYGFALPGEVKMIKTLRDIDYSGKADLSAQIESLYQRKWDVFSVGSLSLLLMAMAEQGEQASYKQASAKLQAFLGYTFDSTLNAWMEGRLLLAADSIGDKATVEQIEPELTRLLNGMKSGSTPPPTNKNYPMYAFSWGYLAALNQKQYQLHKADLIVVANELIKEVTQGKSPLSDHDRLTNAVWMLVMNLQAAANAQDKKTYNHFLQQLKSVTKQHSVSAALSHVLIRATDSSDYPAWAMSIVYLSAVTLHDQVLSQELKTSLEQTLRDAQEWENRPNQSEENQWKAKAEIVIARLNATLAQYR